MSGRDPATCPQRPAEPDALGAHELRAWNEHVERCVPCRRAWMAEDPVRVFGDLRDDPIPAEVLDAVSAAVARSIDADRSIRRRAAWLVSAAAVVLASLLGLVVAVRDASPVGPVHADAIPGRSIPGAIRADVELRSPGADVQVVDLTVGDRQVVLIYDGDLQL